MRRKFFFRLSSLSSLNRGVFWLLLWCEHWILSSRSDMRFSKSDWRLAWSPSSFLSCVMPAAIALSTTAVMVGERRADTAWTRPLYWSSGWMGAEAVAVQDQLSWPSPQHQPWWLHVRQTVGAPIMSIHLCWVPRCHRGGGGSRLQGRVFKLDSPGAAVPASATCGTKTGRLNLFFINQYGRR